MSHISNMKYKLLLPLLIPLIFSCSGKSQLTNSEAVKDSSSYVILVSIDGFRYDYAEKFNATNILKMKQTGSWAKSMIPSFPSKTFPNHYSLVTGMYPGTHGIVSNSFYSQSRGEEYSIGKPSVLDGSWYGGTPLWVLAEQNNIKAASYFWVGSEAKIKGVRPSYYFKYDGRIPNSQRVEKVTDWLTLPKKKRPQFITLYFSDVDSKGHKFGPDDIETKNAVLSIDQLIGELRWRIARSGLDVTLIVTSDHGMASINEPFYLDVDFRGAKTVFSSTSVSIFHDDSDVLEEIKADIQAINDVQVYSAGDFPTLYHFENEDRSGDLLVTIDPPKVFSTRQSVSGGTHGYDPYEHRDMHTIFYIEGSQIKSNFEIGSFENVHVYPLVATILGLPIPDDIDGNVDVLKRVLKDRP